MANKIEFEELIKLSLEEWEKIVPVEVTQEGKIKLKLVPRTWPNPFHI